MFLLVEILLKSAIANHKSKVFAPLAQLAEQVTLNHWVAGSSPARCTFRSRPLYTPGGVGKKR
jgi:hypothetical protein